jgi:hypothetical protein
MESSPGPHAEKRASLLTAFAVPAVALFVLVGVFAVALGRGTAADDRTRQEAYRRRLEERSRERPTHPHSPVPVRR